MYDKYTNQVAKEKMNKLTASDRHTLITEIFDLRKTKAYTELILIEQNAYSQALLDVHGVMERVLNKKPEIDGLNGTEEALAIKSMTQSQTAEVL